MKFQLSTTFREKYKNQNIRIRKAVDNALVTFYKNPSDSSLNNHPLKRNLSGFRSINITADYRAIYEELKEKDGSVFAYFANFGTHKELFQL